jgi:hypothetical protein
MPFTNVEWNSLISVGGAIVSAAIASTVTYKLTSRSITETASEGKLQRDHEREMANEAGTQARRQDAYVTIQKYLSIWYTFAKRKQDAYIISRDRPGDILPEVSEEADAVAALLASQQVTNLVERVQINIGLFKVSNDSALWYKDQIDPRRPGSKDEFYEAMREVRQSAWTLAASIDEAHSQMRLELLGPSGVSVSKTPIRLYELEAGTPTNRDN